MRMSKGAIGNLVNRYRAVLKKCYLINMFRTMFISLALGTGYSGTALAIDYTVDKDTHWAEYTDENYGHRGARVIHGGDTLKILNNSVITFDFNDSSSAVPFIEGGIIISSEDNRIPGDVSVEGGTIIGKSAEPGKGYGVISYPKYSSNITLTNTNLKLENFEVGIYAGNGKIKITNNEMLFDSIGHNIFTSNQGEVDIQSNSLVMEEGDFGVYSRDNSSVNIHNGKEIKLYSKHSGIYTQDDATASMQSSNITLNSPYTINARGNSSVSVNADALNITAQSIVYAKDEAKINLFAKKSGTIKGDVKAYNSSNISFGLCGNTEWTGGSLKDDTASVQINIENKAVWNVSPVYVKETGYQPSAVSLLKFKEGTVDLASAPEYQKLAVGELSGNGGTFRLKVEKDTADGVDQVNINNYASGNNFIYISSSGHTEIAAKDMSTFLVRQAEGTGTFNLANTGQQVDLGLYLYELGSRTEDTATEWYLKRVSSGIAPDTPTGEAEASLSGLAGHYAMWYGQLTDLRKRLGEVRYGTQTGLWVRGFTDKSRLDGLAGSSFTQNLYGGSIGYDTLAAVDEKYMWIVGMQLRSAHADQHTNGRWGGHGDLTSMGGGLYSTWVHADGWYVDAAATMDWYNHKIRATMRDGTRVHDDRSSYGLGASLEAGRKIDFGFSNEGRDHWFVEPQLQLSYFWVKGGDFTASNGMEIDQKDMDSLTGRAGLVLGKKFALDGGNGSHYIQPYVKAGLNHEFLGEQEARLNGVRMTSHLEGTRGYYGVGVDWQATDNLRLYMQAEREHGEHFTREYNVSAGLKWSF
ncbi:autotransporter outer membrane beta-barrel domain-containing protein [uncultured Desulfovibrio sp.]|uniref:autotransporter outer membrane beta-barrel domain-containing protein n=1 Tax=uncultured Desulfovibrio sp. TaxID=167968 RepID=UPI00266EB23D|nr:autotransporter outer membrane beta-barrel domain-containing protein [uncultured Desulfovibrio sp.]